MLPKYDDRTGIGLSFQKEEWNKKERNGIKVASKSKTWKDKFYLISTPKDNHLWLWFSPPSPPGQQPLPLGPPRSSQPKDSWSAGLCIFSFALGVPLSFHPILVSFSSSWLFFCWYKILKTFILWMSRWSTLFDLSFPQTSFLDNLLSIPNLC